MDTSQLPGRGIKLLLSLRKHYRVSLVVWFLVLLLGAPVAWIKGQSYYSAESVFQVSPNYMKTMSADKELEFQSNTQYREFVNHLSTTVTRYDVLGRALKKLSEAKIDIPRKNLTERKFTEQLQKRLSVRAIPDTYMVRITMNGTKQEPLAEIVNSVTNAFLETTRSEQIYGSVERLEALQGSSTRLQNEVAALEAQRLTLAELLGLTTFGENTVNPYDAMRAHAQEKLAIASVERAQAEAILTAFLSTHETPASVGRSLMEMRLQDNGLQSLRNEVVKRSEELLRTTAGLQDGHPAKKPAQAEFETINKRLQTRESEFDTAAFDGVKKRLVASVNQTKQVEAEIARSVNNTQAQAADYAKNFQQAMRLTSEIRKREQELKETRDRLNYLQTESGAIGFVRLVSPALPAESPYGIGKTKLLLVVLLLASALALAVPVVLDLLDQRIYTVNDAEKLMGMPAAGWQLEVNDLPSQMYAKEQTRRFASTLIRDKSRAGKQVFAFTAVTSWTAARQVIVDTAMVLQQLGVRVLLVDASAVPSSPAFGELGPGLSELLAGQADPDSVQQTHVHQDQSLHVVGFGRAHGSGVQRLDLLKDAVRQWSAQYDFVLIGLPPLLLSADAELLIDALGQIFMVLEAQSVTRGEVTRAKRLLAKIDPQALGLFVNNVPMFRGGGYLQQVLVETLTHRKFREFMTGSNLRLEFELLRARWAKRRLKQSPASHERD